MRQQERDRLRERVTVSDVTNKFKSPHLSAFDLEQVAAAARAAADEAARLTASKERKPRAGAEMKITGFTHDFWYLNGVTVTVVKSNRTQAVVKIPLEITGGSDARWYARKYRGKEISIAFCRLRAEKVEDLMTAAEDLAAKEEVKKETERANFMSVLGGL